MMRRDAITHGNLTTQLSRAHGWPPTRHGRSDRAWAGAASRAQVRAASLFTGVVLLLLAGCGGSSPAASSPAGQTRSPSSTSAGTRQPAESSASPSATTAAIPQPAHTVVVVMENHSYAQIIGNPTAPFINALADRGALFTRSRALTHPSEPNYLALFSGSTQGVTDDSCPNRFTAPNLTADLIRAGKSFAGYAEDLPGPGSPVCSAGDYARKHVPWADFSNVPGSVSLPLTSFPAAAFARLPSVSFVI